jgi:hypothetical protein
VLWGISFFSRVNIGRLIHTTATWAITAPCVLFAVSPDEAHAQQLSMFGRTKEVTGENQRRKDKLEALERSHEALLGKYRQLEMELIDVRCQRFMPR